VVQRFLQCPASFNFDDVDAVGSNCTQHLAQRVKFFGEKKQQTNIKHGVVKKQLATENDQFVDDLTYVNICQYKHYHFSWPCEIARGYLRNNKDDSECQFWSILWRDEATY